MWLSIDIPLSSAFSEEWIKSHSSTFSPTVRFFCTALSFSGDRAVFLSIRVDTGMAKML